MIGTVATILVGVVAAAHLGFLVMEMFPWKRPAVFDQVHIHFTCPQSENESAAAPIVWNAGLYNGFIAAGLIWAVLAGHGGRNLCLFFLSCAIIAGVFGGHTLAPIIYFLQALPAIIALAAVLWMKP